MHDILSWFDNSGKYHEGLVDCCDSMVFDVSLKERWDKTEIEVFSDHKFNKPQFHQWYVK